MSIPKNDMRQRLEGRPIITLGDYIRQKQDKSHLDKMSFDDWWGSLKTDYYLGLSKDQVKHIWLTAQANKV